MITNFDILKREYYTFVSYGNDRNVQLTEVMVSSYYFGPLSKTEKQMKRTFFPAICVSVLGERKRRRVPLVTGDKWA